MKQYVYFVSYAYPLGFGNIEIARASLLTDINQIAGLERDLVAALGERVTPAPVTSVLLREETV